MVAEVKGACVLTGSVDLQRQEYQSVYRFNAQKLLICFSLGERD